MNYIKNDNKIINEYPHQKLFAGRSPTFIYIYIAVWSHGDGRIAIDRFQLIVWNMKRWEISNAKHWAPENSSAVLESRMILLLFAYCVVIVVVLNTAVAVAIVVGSLM